MSPGDFPIFSELFPKVFVYGRTGMLLAPIGNPEPKRLRPSGHPACPCSDYPSCSHTMDAPLPEQAKQAQRFARIAGRFLCLYLFSGGWTVKCYNKVVTEVANKIY